VFETILEKAHNLCDALQGSMFLREGQNFRAVTNRGMPEAFAERLRQGIAADGPVLRPLVAGEAFVHIPDMAGIDHPVARAIGIGAARAVLGGPLRNTDELVGMIVAGRREARPFTDKQIALLQSFASQAVIAMEHARLLGEIRQRQQELRVTFDNMADGVAMFDARLRLAAWNTNFQELLDLPVDFLAQHHTFDEYIRYLTERGEFGETDAEAQIARLRARVGEHYSFERTRPDGTVIEVRHNPMPDDGFVLIFGDITERKRSEAEIRTARDAAEAAYRDLQAAQSNLVQAQKMAALGQLTAGIAHEIKNPLNFVNNFASLSTELLDELKEDVAPALGSLDESKREDINETFTMLTGNLDKIVEHGQRADNIVKSMLEHSRGVSGERREVDLNGVIEEALNLAYHGARAQDQGFNIALERDYEPRLKPIELAPQEMTRVFLNLFGNGFYATSKRARDNGAGSFRPVLTVRTREAGDGVEVRVRDNGTGIPSAIKDKLFQPFFTTKPTGEGTGLGLSISYDIVTQQHGGTITVESEEGSYTEFTLRLPRR
jgi:PAS domain S-box-containing protein